MSARPTDSAIALNTTIGVVARTGACAATITGTSMSNLLLCVGALGTGARYGYVYWYAHGYDH